MQKQKAPINPMTVIGVVALAMIAVGIFGPLGQPLRDSRQGKVVRAEVETEHGEFEVNLTSVSSVHGMREHTEPRDNVYTLSFGKDILLAEGEKLDVYLTAVAVPTSDARKRALRCRLRENGKEIVKASHAMPVPMNQAGQPAGCAWSFYG